jgi:hypothetical protein
VIFILADYEASDFKMNSKIQDIRQKLANLEKEADELKRLKSDYHYARQFRRMIVKQEVD